MKIGNGNFKAQSAMEYLMTYGWAILIIAVVLAALFSLNVFNAGANLGTSCIPSPGFLCQSPVLSGTTGSLSFQVGQNAQLSASGQTYNTAFACVSSSNSNTIGSAVVFNGINTAGASILNVYTSGNPNGGDASNSLASGSQLTISGIQCYTQGGLIYSAQPIGSVFTGALWMAYNQTSNTGKDNLYTKVATISVRTSS